MSDRYGIVIERGMSLRVRMVDETNPTLRGAVADAYEACKDRGAARVSVVTVKLSSGGTPYADRLLFTLDAEDFNADTDGTEEG
jgi:hypothetical protein